MNLLAIDIGTTHCKAGLFDGAGQMVAVSSRTTPTQRSAGTQRSTGMQQSAGSYAYDPQQLWQQVTSAVRDVTQGVPAQAIAGVGISSMAETGLLLQQDGTPRTAFIPWFDTRTLPQAQRLRHETEVQPRFYQTGMRPTYKCAVARLLWLEWHDPGITDDATWLSVADYVAYRLTGAIATDYSLAGRTYAFRLADETWDVAWLRELGLDAVHFPEAVPSGTVVGQVQAEVGEALGLMAKTPVVIGGHDHVCAAFAAGAVEPEIVFDSMGTAETLVGTLPQRTLSQGMLTAQHFESGLTVGRHAAHGRYYWMGGLSTSGGSIEWLRRLLNDPALSYQALDGLVQELLPQPTGILYFPYLSGSGSPHPDERLRGAFVGLSTEHGRAHLVQAVLEGTAYEIEWIRRAAAKSNDLTINRMVAAGGGTRNRRWLQIKADVCGRPFAALATTEATLLGAALLAGLGSGVYGDEAEALSLPAHTEATIYEPDPARHDAYRHLFEEGYCGLQAALRGLVPALQSEATPSPTRQDAS